MLCRSLCYKEPQLTAEDLAWDGTVEGGEDTERVKMTAMMGGLQQVHSMNQHMSSAVRLLSGLGNAAVLYAGEISTPA